MSSAEMGHNANWKSSGVPYEQRYDFERGEIHDATKRLLIEKQHLLSGLDNERYVCFRFEGTDPYSIISRDNEARVFDDAFEGNDPLFMKNEYGPYERVSTFYTVVDRKLSFPAGTIRIGRNREDASSTAVGLKTLDDLNNPDKVGITVSPEEVCDVLNIDLDTCVDGATAAVPKEYRHMGAASINVLLQRAWYVDQYEVQGKKDVVSVMDENIVGILRYFGVPLHPIYGGTNAESRFFPYLGSERSQAVHGHLPDFFPAVKEKWDSATDPVLKLVLDSLAGGASDHKLVFLKEDFVKKIA